VVGACLGLVLAEVIAYSLIEISYTPPFAIVCTSYDANTTRFSVLAFVFWALLLHTGFGNRCLAKCKKLQCCFLHFWYLLVVCLASSYN